MKNTLIQDNFYELMKLSEENREMVMTYFNNWTESLPAYFDDNDTLQEKIEKTFTKWFDEHHNMENYTAEDVIETLYDSFQVIASYLEYSVDAIVSYYNGVYDEELFKELIENYLEDNGLISTFVKDLTTKDMTKRIIIQDYPATFYFDVKKDLPVFNEQCEVRNKILLHQLKRHNIDSPCHSYNDYVVEMVEPILNGEIWIIGS